MAWGPAQISVCNRICNVQALGTGDCLNFLPTSVVKRSKVTRALSMRQKNSSVTATPLFISVGNGPSGLLSGPGAKPLNFPFSLPLDSIHCYYRCSKPLSP